MRDDLDDRLLLKEAVVFLVGFVGVLLMQFVVELRDRLGRFEVATGKFEAFQVQVVDRHQIEQTIGFDEELLECHQFVAFGFEQTLQEYLEAMLKAGRQAARFRQGLRPFDLATGFTLHA